ncbi:MAG: exopolyphosphatase, partial [Pirellulaceae bacterium]
MSSTIVNRPNETLAPQSRPVAVIDIGATNVRMAIAEIDASGRARILETLSQPISLGKDTFALQRIRKTSIEE